MCARVAFFPSPVFSFRYLFFFLQDQAAVGVRVKSVRWNEIGSTKKKEPSLWWVDIAKSNQQSPSSHSQKKKKVKALHQLTEERGVMKDLCFISRKIIKHHHKKNSIGVKKEKEEKKPERKTSSLLVGILENVQVTERRYLLREEENKKKQSRKIHQ